jgi:putative endonuclease
MAEKRMNRERGAQGERAAAEYLESRGAKILAMNYTCWYGELDLIAHWDGVIVFVEVKLRNTARFGRPGEAVGYEKRKKISRCAMYYLKTTGGLDRRARFDVIEIMPEGIRHVPSAFDCVMN